MSSCFRFWLPRLRVGLNNSADVWPWKDLFQKISAKELHWGLALLVLCFGITFKGRLLSLLPAGGTSSIAAVPMPGLVTAHPEPDADPGSWPPSWGLDLPCHCGCASWLQGCRWPWPLSWTSSAVLGQMYRVSALPAWHLPVALDWLCFAEPCLPLLLSGSQVEKAKPASRKLLASPKGGNKMHRACQAFWKKSGFS